jgi:hypothetical protein
MERGIGMIITGFLEIEEQEVVFFFDGEKIVLAPQNTISRLVPVSPEHFDLIRGVTSTNQEIFFVGCEYYQGRQISIQGWIIGTTNTGYIDITGYDSLTFSGLAVDAFFSPGRAFQMDEKFDIENYRRIPSLVSNNFEDFTEIQKCIIDGVEIEVEMSVYIDYSLQETERTFGTRYSLFRMNFQQQQQITELTKHFLCVYDFFRFVVFRNNVCFDKMDLWRRDTDSGKYERIATAHFFPGYEKNGYKGTEQKVITYNDMEKHFSDLFELVAMRRQSGIEDTLFIPKTDKEGRLVNHTNFLITALSFEGEFTRRYPDIKAVSNPMFSNIKQEIFELLDAKREEFLEQCTSNKVKKKADNYFGKFRGVIEKTDSSLEEKFNQILKDNEFLHTMAADYCKQEKCEHIENYGKVFADMRNAIGHGFPPKIGREHVVIMRLARAMVYFMILSEASFTNGDIETILKKMPF